MSPGIGGKNMRTINEKAVKALEKLGVSTKKRGCCPIMAHDTDYVHWYDHQRREWRLESRRPLNAETKEEFGRFRVEIVAVLNYGGASLGSFTGSHRSLNLKAHELVRRHMASLPRQHREQAGVCHAVMSNGESLFSFFI